jgi:hypothetical protein
MTPSTTTKSQGALGRVAELLRRNEAEIAGLVAKYCEFLREPIQAAQAGGSVAMTPADRAKAFLRQMALADFPCLVTVRPLPHLRMTDADAALTAEQRMHALTSGEVMCGIDIGTPRSKKPRKPRKPRRPSISTMIEQSKKADKPLASITLPDGIKLDFNKAESSEPENNPWLADLRKETKQ